MPNGDIGPEMGGPPQPPTPEQKAPFGVVAPEVPGRYLEPLWSELIRTAERKEEVRWVVRKAISEMEERKDFCDYYAVSTIVGGLKNRRYRIDAEKLFGEEKELSNQERDIRDELERLEKEVEARQRVQNTHALERKYAGDVGQYADMFLQPGKINFEAADMKIIGRAPKTGAEELLDPEKHEEEFGVILDEAMRGYVIVMLADTQGRIEELSSEKNRRGIKKTPKELEIHRRKLEFVRRILHENLGSDNIQEILNSSATKIDFGKPEEGDFGKREINLQEIYKKAISEKIPNVFTGSSLQDGDYDRARKFIEQELKVSREATVLAFNIFRILNLVTVFDANIDGMPTSNDFIKMVHFEYKRAKEYARFRPTKAPYPAGPPSTLGKYPNLITDFLHFKKVEEEGKKKSLWQLWWHEGVGFGFLPWEESRGVGKEDFDFYRYVCWRAKNTYEDLVKEKDLRKFIEEGGFKPRNKNFDITFNDREETGLAHEGRPKENPRVWYMIGMIYEHHPNGYRTPEDVEKKKESIPVAERWNYLTADQLSKIKDEKAAAEAVSKSAIYFLTMGVETGFITAEERKFVEKYCEIEPKFLGLRW